MQWHDLISSFAGVVGALAAIGIFVEIRRALHTIERHDVQLGLLWAEVFGPDTPPPSRGRERQHHDPP